MEFSDYRRFKTPFYEITIYDSKFKRKVKLPHHILRLIQKVEIVETMEESSYPSIVLTFVEGSREPASQDQTQGGNGLYKITSDGENVDVEIAGSLTNRTGVITDLRFSGTGGITWLSESERKLGRVDNSEQKSVDGQFVTREHKSEPKAPSFLFQQRNQVEVTWGYLEDPKSRRTMICPIQIIESNFPDNGAITTTITCQSTSANLDQLTPTKGIPFGEIVKTKNNNIIEFKDLASDELIRKICVDLGIDCIVSTNLLNSKLDKNHQKVWLAGESFKQFLDRLAEEHHCKWKMITNAKTKKDTLIFIKQVDLYSKPIQISNKDLFTYKTPGSILKNIKIKVDFAGVGGSTSVGTNSDASNVGESVDIAQENLVQFNPSGNNQKKQTHVAFDPTGENGLSVAEAIKEKLAAKKITGKVEINPNEDSKSNIAERASTAASNTNNRFVLMDISCLGFTKLSPGIIEINGIGIRYSGKYKVLTVSHIIDESGYNCRASASSEFISSGGVKLSATNKNTQKKDSDEKTDVKQFNPSRDNSTIKDTLNKLNGTA